MKRNEDQMTRALREELELPAVPELVDSRLRQVYAELPDALPTKQHMPTWVRRSLCTAASVAIAFGTLLGLNSLNPAVAEQLPLVGSIFRTVNSNVYGSESQNFREALVRLSERAVELPEEEGTVQTVPAGGVFEKPVTARMREAYYDGEYVFVGFRFDLGGSYDHVWDLKGPGYDVLINGESQIPHLEDGQIDYPRSWGDGYCDLNSSNWTPAGQGEYVMQRAFRVPDRFRDQEELDLTIGFSGISAYGIGPVNSSPFQFDLTVKKQEVPRREIDCQGVEMGGVRLVSATASETALCVVAEYPAELYQNPGADVSSFEDGLWIGSLGGYTLEENGVARCVSVCAGLREDETRRVVWSLFDKNGSGQHEAVFLLDFQNGTAELGSGEDVKSPPVYDYACGVEAVKDLAPGEYGVERLHLSQSKPTLSIMTGDKKRALRAEFWQEGERVYTAYTGEYASWNEKLRYWEYYNLTTGSSCDDPEDDGTRFQGSEHSSYLILIPDLYVALDPTRPVTVKAYDKNSGEQLLSEEVLMTQSELHEPPPPLEEDLEGGGVSSETEE